MVVLNTMAWLSGSNKSSNHTFSGFWLEKSPPKTLQILAFETAKTMSRLVSLYKHLSDDEFSKLRNGPMKSEGVMYLNSDDESFLFNLACAEKLEELNSIAITVSRLGQKCSDPCLKHFDIVYGNIKQGVIDVGKTEYNSGYAEKIVQKMEKYVAATSSLHSALESLAETELSDRKLQVWKLNVGPKLPQKANHAYSEDKLAFQRKQVKHYRETSLWSKTFDKCVGLMARIICIIYVRICDLFGRFVQNLPHVSKHSVRYNSRPKQQHMKVHPEYLDHCVLADKYKYVHLRGFKSGPIPKSSKESGPTRFYSQQLASNNPRKNGILGDVEKGQRVIQLAPPSTVGGAGLVVRYANIIIFAERHLQVPMTVNENARGSMYEMLPASLKATVRGKLRSRWKKEKDENDDNALADGWRDALEKILGWLAPMAHDTVQWQTERNLEKQRFDHANSNPTVLLLQTLYFSDLEKTEAAIVEVLVGLSCIYRYENRRLRDDSPGHCEACAVRCS